MTDDSSNRLTRRTALKGLGGAAATVGVGGAALLAASGPAAAATDDYGDATITSDDGSVKYVSIYGDSRVSWSGFENPADSVDIRIEAKCGDANVGWQDLYSTSGDLSQESWGGDGESHSGVGTSGWLNQDVGLDSDGNHDPSTDWAIVQAEGYSDPYGIPSNSNALPASGFEVDGDGASANYEIEMRSHYTWKAGETEEYSETFDSSLTVTVDNLEKSSSGENLDGESGVTGAGNDQTPTPTAE